ncbi:MAG TPA: penicillin-binding transpeptidase domain-containing protein [Mycobacteriales bacterium]|nr:penicillin-binding transpeptidase domain-containing protein [Mycobacteriales bacterium]
MSDRSRLRIIVLRVLIVSLLATLFGRLWYLQVLAGPQYQQLAANNQVRDIITPAPRGQIVDDAGRAFARNDTALVVSVDRIALMRQSDGGKAVLHRLARVLAMPYGQLHARIQLCGPGAPKGCWNGSQYEPIPVTQLKNDRHSTQLALQILERKEEFPGVTAELAAIRHYAKPLGAYGTHVIGNLGPITQAELAKLPASERAARQRDYVGSTGLEKQYDDYLRGRAGLTQVAVDHIGAVTGTLKETPPEPGDTLVTSLDARVQATLESALAGAVKHARQLGTAGYGGPADFAAGVVLDVKTGHVVAMASYPTYDPSLWDAGRIDPKVYAHLRKAPGFPLVDKAYASAYSPGSTFKLISTAGLLHDGTASLSHYYDCSSSFSIGASSFRNFEGEASGPINLHDTIVQSCDTVYYRLAYADWLRDERLIHAGKKPVEGVQHIARDFGLGEPPGVDLPNATVGHIADRRNQLLRWKQTKRDYCIGAKRRPAKDPIKAFDQEYCTDGWRFNPGDQLIEDIGQGSVLVSPLQLATAYAALANGGTVFQPRLGRAIVSPDGNVVKRLNAPVRDHLPLSRTVLDYIRNAMYDVPLHGTAATAFTGFPMNKVRVGGKTGTAEIGLNRSLTSAWFASFAGLAKDAKPRFACVIMVDKGGVGGTVAAPAVRQVWDTVFGVEGHQAAFPTGQPPSGLPQLSGVTTGPAHAGPGAGSTTTGGRSVASGAWPDLGLPPALPPRSAERKPGEAS